MNITQKGGNLHIETEMSSLNIYDTLDCGQCFRFKQEGNLISGIAFQQKLVAEQTEQEIILYDTTLEQYQSIWSSFFDMDTDYQAIKSSLLFDETISKAIDFAGGIRILKQDSFETLCSFIISQNNNIPRIKGTVERFCERFGERLSDGSYTFPQADSLKGLKKQDLEGLSLGYRDDYIVDCVERVNESLIDLQLVRSTDIENARALLREIKGIGPKVCECVLLFGFHRLEAFPIDTWIKKVLATFYKDGFPKEAMPIAGVAQQYLFHYIRKNKITLL